MGRMIAQLRRIRVGKTRDFRRTVGSSSARRKLFFDGAHSGKMLPSRVYLVPSRRTRRPSPSARYHGSRVTLRAHFAPLSDFLSPGVDKWAEILSELPICDAPQRARTGRASGSVRSGSCFRFWTKPFNILPIKIFARERAFRQRAM